ncbi:MAG: chitobiase/beta-hexosaminidase C-terminal domain-containing protein, partial [bacterium]
SGSSWGPVADGRIKPEVVAVGASTVFEGTTSTLPNDIYENEVERENNQGQKVLLPAAGTSMAAPVVSGIAALIIQQYRTIHGTDPLASTVKALLINTATDMGNKGPDFSYGFGKVDAKAAINSVIEKHDLFGVIGENSIHRYPAEVSSSAESLKVTLVWDDIPAPDNAQKTLINDLKLEVISPTGKRYDPYILDPSVGNESKVATRGVDHINPVEQVVIHNNEMEAGTWSVNVEGDKVPQGPQVYSLVISPFEPEPGKVVISDGIFEDPSTIFAGDEFEITFALKETEGRPVLLQEVGVDIFDANNTLVHQLTRYNNVTVAANGAWDYRSTIVSLDIPGTYRAVAKAVIDEAFVLEAEDSARNPKAFSVNDKFTQNVDIALVIDRSGSMNDENKISDAKKAANFFVGFMQNGDNLAVVSFFVSAAIDFPLTTISGHSTIQNAQNAINRIFADGGTSIAAGILAAQEELNKGNASNPHAIVLLSDGISSAEDVENALSALPEKTIIHTIALGSDADHDLLNRIASKTGGTFNPSSAANVLQLIYENIQGQITGMATAANNLGAISQGATTSHTVTLDALTSLAFFRMGFEGSDVDMELISPTGKEVTPSSAASDPAIDYTEGSTYDFYTVLSPKPGNWTQKIIGVNVPTPETYVASVQVVSQLNLGLTLDRDEYQINEPILISAVLTENGSPLTGASVIADVTSPSASLSAFREASPLVHHSSESAAGNAHPPTTSNLSVKTFEYNSTLMTLYDDGVHGDGVANDGIYANSLTQTQHDGSYSFTVRASGFSSQGGNFERESAISTFVDVPDDQITLLGLSGIEVFVIKQSPADQSVLYAGTNGNGLYKGSVSSHSWSPVSGGLNDNFIYNLQIDPNNSSTIFAGTGGSSGSNSEGVYKSFDGGDSWVVKNDGLPQKQVFSLALDRNNPNIVYAGTNRFGVYKSLNAGDNWSSANNGIPSGREIHVMAIHPTNPKIVLAGTKSGVIYKSFDNGSSWSSRNFPNHSSYIFDFLFDDKNPDVVYASTWGSGVYKSTNGGETWFRKDNGLSDTRIASLAMSAGKLYAGTNSGGIFTSEDNAENWNHFSDQGTFQKVHDIVFKTNDPSTFYAGTNSGVYRVKDPSLAGVVATPILNPPTGTYSKGITVYMYISTNDATIYYTTDGSFPSESSQQYTSPFTVSSSQTITARAFRSGFIPCSNASSVYIITGTTASPQFEPQPGTYTSPVQVSISTTTPGAAIHFTGDSSEPTQSSEIYASSIPVSSTTTVRARAYKSGWAPSHEVSGTYEIRGVLTAPRLDPAPGNYATSLDVSISTTVDDATVRYTVNGSTPTTSSPVYNSPIPVTQTTTIKAAAFKTGWPAGNMTTGAYVITGKLDPLQFDPPPGTFDSSVNVTLSSTVEDAIIYFTLDNSEPTESAFPYSDQIMIDSTATLKARAYKSGWAPSDVMSGKYVIDKPTSVQDAPIPEKFVLYQNYPNPFNPETRISFDLPETQHVEITIFNATGQRIKTIANRRHEAGTYSIVWNARDNLGNPVGSGIYFYRIKTVKFIQTKKMALLR